MDSEKLSEFLDYLHRTREVRIARKVIDPCIPTPNPSFTLQTFISSLIILFKLKYVLSDSGL